VVFAKKMAWNRWKNNQIDDTICEGDLIGIVSGLEGQHDRVISGHLDVQ
jgi:hypothetical protein